MLCSLGVVNRRTATTAYRDWQVELQGPQVGRFAQARLRAMRSLSVNIPIVSRNPWLGRVKPKKARSREECRHESRYSDTACTDSSAVDLVSIEDQFDS